MSDGYGSGTHRCEECDNTYEIAGPGQSDCPYCGHDPYVRADGGETASRSEDDTERYPPGFPPCPGCREVGFSVQKWTVDHDGEEVQMWQCDNTDCRVEEYGPRDCDPQEESGAIGL